MSERKLSDDLALVQAGPWVRDKVRALETQLAEAHERIRDYQAACEQKDEIVRGAVETNRQLAEARSALEAAQRERDDARAFGEEAARRHNALLADGRVLRCAFCDAEYPPGTPPSQAEALSDHVKVCQAHPMREVEVALAAEVERGRALREAATNGLDRGLCVALCGIDAASGRTEWKHEPACRELRAALAAPPSPAAMAPEMCKCGHPRANHSFYEDHDECGLCNEEPDCNEFRLIATPAATETPAPAAGLEPRGCPTPGACSCPGSALAAGLVETKLRAALEQHLFRCCGTAEEERKMSPCGTCAMGRAALAIPRTAAARRVEALEAFVAARRCNGCATGLPFALSPSGVVVHQDCGAVVPCHGVTYGKDAALARLDEEGGDVRP